MLLGIYSNISYTRFQYPNTRFNVTTARLPYQIISRRFRPQTFQDVLGQPAIVTTLKNALRFQRLAHAYLFCGTRGTGKTTIARVFAKALNCHQLTEAQEPCNVCPSCLEILSGKSLDVLEIDGASNRGIDDIRQINETMGYTPASGKFKIYIIDEVHMLTKEAFNALLKTLEEPPSTVKFFFATTEPHKVLSTIISRCQRFDLHRISAETMQQKLESIVKELSIPCKKEALTLIARLSEGSLRDAESLLDRVICYAETPIGIEQIGETLGLMPKETFFALDHAIIQGTYPFAFDLAHNVFSSGKDFSYFLEHLLEHFQTHLQVKWKREISFLSRDHQVHYEQASLDYSEEQLLYILDYLLQWQQQLSKTPFKRIGLEMVLLQLLRSKNRVCLSAITQKLYELQAALSPSDTEKKKEELPSPEPFSNTISASTTPLTLTENEEKEGKSLEEDPPMNASSPALPEILPSSSSNENTAPGHFITDRSQQSRYDTLIRFAMVELEAGVIPKSIQK